MALHFSANQYDKNFNPILLQNWEVPRQYRERMIRIGMRDCRPRAFVGFTQIVASDKGHLLPGVKRSRESPWGTFIGTWDMPLKIPGNNMMNSTARSENAALRLDRIKTEGDIVLGGMLKQCKVPSPLPVKADRDADNILPPKPTGTQQSFNGLRSGAMNPEPKSSVDVPASPGIRAHMKPCTPNIAWPRPASHGSRIKSASPKIMTPKSACPKLVTIKSPLPAIHSLAPGTPAVADFKWPSPRAADEMNAA